jgi:hypothetical protein
VSLIAVTWHARIADFRQALRSSWGTSFVLFELHAAEYLVLKFIVAWLVNMCVSVVL